MALAAVESDREEREPMDQDPARLGAGPELVDQAVKPAGDLDGVLIGECDALAGEAMLQGILTRPHLAFDGLGAARVGGVAAVRGDPGWAGRHWTWLSLGLWNWMLFSPTYSAESRSLYHSIGFESPKNRAGERRKTHQFPGQSRTYGEFRFRTPAHPHDPRQELCG